MIVTEFYSYISQNHSDPPPAHSSSRKDLHPQQALSTHGTSQTPIFYTTQPHSSSIHPTIPTLTHINEIDLSLNVQSKPLDLGISGRCQNIDNDSCTQKPKINESENVSNKMGNSDLPLTIHFKQIEDKGPKLSSVISNAENLTFPKTTLTTNSVDLTLPQIETSDALVEDTNPQKNSISNGVDDTKETILESIDISINAAIQTVQANLGDDHHRSSSTTSSPAPSPSSAQSIPTTPRKCSVDHDKTSSQGKKISNVSNIHNIH